MTVFPSASSTIAPWFRLGLGLTLALAVACSGDDDGTDPTKDGPGTESHTGDSGPTVGDDDDDDDDGQPLTLAATAQVSVHVPSVVHLTGTTPEGAPDGARLTATATPTDASLPTVTTEATATAGSPFLLPLSTLVHSQSYDVVVTLSDAGGDELATQALPVTAPVPPGALTYIAGQNTAQPIEPGYIAMALIGGDDSSYLAVVDDQARLVWWKPAEEGQIIITPMLGRDGETFVWGEYDVTKLNDTGTWHRIRFDGTEATSRRLQLSHHAAVELPDGDLVWLAFDFRDVLNSDGVTRRMATDRLFTGPETYAAEPTELFNNFDDFPDLPTLTCEHMTSDFDRFDERDIVEWTHGNSLAYVDSEDALYINAKQTDWVLKIDGQTGELLWQLGGIGSDFTYPDGSPTWTSAFEPTLFSHAHMSHVWEGGMVTFDNGDHRTPKVSSAAELAWDEQARTVERVWEFYHPGGGHTFPLGDVKKLDDGTYLVGWGALSELMVVDPDHTVRWRATVPSMFTIGRVLPLESL
jgi:hypothetical protein